MEEGAITTIHSKHPNKPSQPNKQLRNSNNKLLRLPEDDGADKFNYDYCYLNLRLTLLFYFVTYIYPKLFL